ncbi:hypothetical protein C1646_760632 [Rhizophagus diaphanus]|nr:hypothetical protein C1646_760632 [Rhizophagus diaphanus] [Rhizophagus sp. MUCL 43196]
MVWCGTKWLELGLGLELGVLVRKLLRVRMFEKINDFDFKNPSVDLPLEDEINLFKCNDFEDYDEVEDSPLKELYSGQTFTSFDILEQCLK